MKIQFLLSILIAAAFAGCDTKAPRVADDYSG